MIEVAVFEYHGHMNFEIANDNEVAAFEFTAANAKEVANALRKLATDVEGYDG